MKRASPLSHLASCVFDVSVHSRGTQANSVQFFWLFHLRSDLGYRASAIVRTPETICGYQQYCRSGMGHGGRSIRVELSKKSLISGTKAAARSKVSQTIEA